MAGMKFRLVLILWLQNYSTAQDANCDYYQRVAVGATAYIYSPYHPNSYSPGQQCRWIAVCPPGYNCRLDCREIRLPESASCSMDRLMVSRIGDPQLIAAETYCGTGSLSGIVSIAQTISIGLISSTNSPGGRFECTVTPQIIKPPPVTCRCGERRQNRIVGGQETGINEFTMVAGIADVRIKQIKCGGVIITAKDVLTAAHCVFEQSVTDYAVVVGEHNVSTGDSPATKAYAITKFTIHLGFTTVNYDNDIAIVKVDKEIQFNDFVRPVCMPFLQRNNDFAGSKVTIVGWGTIFAGGPTSDVPMKVDLDVLQQSTCRSRGAAVTDRQMCTFTAGKDSCQDDSGGPLLWTNPSNGAIYAAGIVSYGQFCASDTPSINTRVTSFLDWIVANTQIKNAYCIK